MFTRVPCQHVLLFVLIFDNIKDCNQFEMPLDMTAHRCGPRFVSLEVALHVAVDVVAAVYYLSL